VVAFELAQHHSSEIAAAFPVAGTLEAGASQALSPPLPPVHAFLGGSDPVFPLRGVQESIAALQAQGFTADLQVFPGLDHDMNDAEIAALQVAIEAQLPR